MSNPHPTAVIIARQEPWRDLSAFPQVSAPFPLDMPIQVAPAPVAYTEWWNVGRDAQHAWPTRWLYQSLAIPDWLSVAGWPFTGQHSKPGSMASMPVGQFNSMAPRANIMAPPQTSLGALAAVDAPLSVAPAYAKLT